MNDWNSDQETVLEKIRQNALIMKKSNTKAQNCRIHRRNL